MTDETKSGEGIDPTGERGEGAAEKPAGTEKSRYTAPISGEDQEEGQTGHSAPDDDTGVPDEPGRD